jgi:hypothetical protein
MTENKLKNETRRLINENKIEEAATHIFDAYLILHPTATNIPLFRDKVVYKLKNELVKATPEKQQELKMILVGLITVIGDSEGETAFNLFLLLLHFLHKGHPTPISEAIALIKLDKASNNLNN